jgi:2-iminobutanoate/2-iminopropanoate deaminase
MALPFSTTREGGGFIFVSGQVALTDEGKLLEGSMEEQTHQVMKNLQSALQSAGASLSDIVKTTIYVVDMSTSKEVSDTYVGYLTEPYPAREFICVKELPLGAQVEISVIAKKPE